MFDVIRDELREIEHQWEGERDVYLQTIADREERIEELEDELNDTNIENRELRRQNEELAAALNQSSDIIERQNNAIVELENELQGS